MDIESNQSDRIARLEAIQKALDLAEHICNRGYFVSSNELAEIMDLQASVLDVKGVRRDATEVLSC
ncbi:MAG: hypothetical protein F6J97_08230 [Leptolyngbya sp. SIO4C1]|nr:hypothetical protein [Leptolyngbya sp. SIO4C1]